MTGTGEAELPDGEAAGAPVPARDAATVLLLRDRPGGVLEVHLQQRRAEMFGAHALVFPGGAVDAADADARSLASVAGVDLGDAARRMRLDGDDAARVRCVAHHLCAVREVFEEAGLLLATRPDGGDEVGLDEVVVAEARDRLLAGGHLVTELDALGMRPQVEALVYIAHFITPLGIPRRYDTRFFAAQAPLGIEARHHAGEAVAGGWFTPAELIGPGAGDVVLMPPTRIVLAELARHRGTEAVLAALGARAVAPIRLTSADITGPLPDHLPGVEEYEAMVAARAPQPTAVRR